MKINALSEIFNGKRMAIHAFIVFVVSFATLLFLYPYISMTLSKMFFIFDNKIKTIVLFNSYTPSNSLYIYAGQRIRFYTDKDSKTLISSETLMQMENTTFLNSALLEDNEITLPINTAIAYGLHEGDVIFADTGYMDTRKEYVIKSITPVFYGFIESLMLDYGMIVAGYDNDFHTRLKNEYVLFSRDTFDMMPDNIRVSANDIIISYNALLLYSVFLALYITVYWAVIISTMQLIKYFLKPKYKEQMCLLYRNGLRTSVMSALSFFISGFVLFLPMLLSLFLYQILMQGKIIISHNGNILLFLLYAVISAFYLLQILIVCIKEGRITIWKMK